MTNIAELDRQAYLRSQSGDIGVEIKESGG
jgi:hypothetical protein